MFRCSTLHASQLPPNDPDEDHTKKNQKQQGEDEEPNDEIPRSGDCVGVRDPF